jgi:hypothetical protein
MMAAHTPVEADSLVEWAKEDGPAPDSQYKACKTTMKPTKPRTSPTKIQAPKAAEEILNIF